MAKVLCGWVITHAHLLPLGEVVRNLPDEGALSKILTNLPDSDRQLLTRIVERWGGLSEELKRAVFRVMGSGN